MFQDVLMDFSWASLLLLAGYFLRAKVKIFQKLFIPVSVIAGLLGLLLGADVLGKVSPFYIQWSEYVSSYANPLLAILFVSQFLTLRMEFSRIKKCALVFLISGVTMASQVGLAIPLVRLFSVPDGFAVMPFSGFYGAHGIPSIAAGIYEALGYWSYEEASSVGTTFATVGMLFGIIAGIAFINIAIRKHWLVSDTAGKLTEEELTGYVQKENREPFMSAVSKSSAVNPLAVHCAIIGMVMILGYLLLFQIQKISMFSSFAIQIPAIIVALIVNVIASKTKLKNIMDEESLHSIGGTALEYLIITAVATTNLIVVVSYGVPILVISAIILVVTTVLVVGLSKLWLKNNWFENAMVMFGSWTGSTATGLMLLRVADPEMETDAGPNLIMATPFWQVSTQSFFMMAAPYMLVTAAGCTNLLMICAAMFVGMLLVGFVLSRKYGVNKKSMAILKVKTQNGLVEGLRAGNNRISVFKGIPYAKPPVGSLRWKAPEPAEPWDGVRKAFSYSPIPIQPIRPKGDLYQKLFFPVDMEQSEDCLYLNVWTPADSPEEKLPVAVWIYGGGYTTGYANKIEFDGEAFASRGCVYVSINYRVGLMGFMAHLDLAIEDEHGVSGNYGFLDQVAALRWVQENIDAFGGDPDNVTILGQSAGAFSCMNLSCSPITRGLFKRVVSESCGGLDLARYYDIPTLQAAEQYGKTILSELHVSSISQARELDAQELMNRMVGLQGFQMMVFQPNVDGCYIPETPTSCIMHNRHHKLDYLVGSTESEGYIFGLGQTYDPKAFAEEMHLYFREDTKEYLEAIGYSENGETPPTDFFGDVMLSAGIAWNELELKRGGTTNYQYYFTKKLTRGDVRPAFHSAEHAYIFQTLNRIDLPYDGSDFELSNMMCDYWTNFIKTGNPNGTGLPEWKRYQNNREKIMELGSQVRMIDIPDRIGAKYTARRALKLATQV
ncbi:MAG: carboxylesterase family protein [Lachnospiraceae bacterium]|nr:carboxylesterase family protein [Lachnospiraceae bacterium]